MTLTLIHATALARLGLSVFPVRGGSKTPAILNWRSRATADLAALNALFHDHPATNLGVATGPASRVFVLDIDCKGADGYESLARLQEAHGQLPATWRSQTPSGGAHLWFAMPEDRPMGNRVGFAPGLDIRGDGGFVVVPPSCVGGPYAWISPPDACPPAQAPSWLLDLAAPQRRPPQYAPAPIPTPQSPERLVRYVTKAVEGEFIRVSGASPGQRNTLLFQAAANLGELVAGSLLQFSLAVEVLTRAAEQCGLAEEDSRAVQATIASGLSRGAANPREIA